MRMYSSILLGCSISIHPFTFNDNNLFATSQVYTKISCIQSDCPSFMYKVGRNLCKYFLSQTVEDIFLLPLTCVLPIGRLRPSQLQIRLGGVTHFQNLFFGSPIFRIDSFGLQESFVSDSSYQALRRNAVQNWDFPRHPWQATPVRYCCSISLHVFLATIVTSLLWTIAKGDFRLGFCRLAIQLCYLETNLVACAGDYGGGWNSFAGKLFLLNRGTFWKSVHHSSKAGKLYL